MYISLFTLLVVGGFIVYYLWKLNKNSNHDLDIINLILAVSYVEKNTETHKKLKDHPHRYAFLLQYLLDIHNLKISELNDKWLAIYNFFQTRTRHSGSGIAIKYLKYGRLHPDVVMHIADMYKNNAYFIGNGLWEESHDSLNRLGKDHMDKGGYYYPESLEDLIETIAVYDKEYVGHVMMDKRSSKS